VAEAPPSEGLTAEASLSVPTTTTSSMLLNRYFYREKEMKHLRKPKAEKPAGKRDETLKETESRETSSSLRSSLLIKVCPLHYKGVTIYRRPLGMIIYLNYTFSVPDKRL
jgi:hypothetical protein